MNAVMQRPAPTRESIRQIVRILAVLAARFLTGAGLGFGAMAAYEMLHTSEPLLYTDE